MRKFDGIKIKLFRFLVPSGSFGYHSNVPDSASREYLGLILAHEIYYFKGWLLRLRKLNVLALAVLLIPAFILLVLLALRLWVVKTYIEAMILELELRS